MKRLFFLFFLTHLLATVGYSQHQVTDHYTVSDGLPFIHVYTLHQDSLGRLWVGGYGGLSIFDGYEFQNLSKRDGLSSNWIRDISSNEYGVYIASNGGLNLIRSDGNISEVEGLEQVQTNQLIKVSKDKQLLVISEAGVHSVKGEQSQIITRNNRVIQASLQGNTLYWIDPDSLYSMDLDNREHHTSEALSFNPRCIEALQDKLLVGSTEGLWIKGVRGWNNLRPEDGLPHPVINDIEQVDQELWVATNYGMGIIAPNGEIKIQLIGSNQNSNQCERIMHDKEDQIWVGTYNGLYQLSRQSFEKIGYEEGFYGVHIYQIVEDVDGHLWIGTQKNGAFEYNGASFIARNARHGLKGNEVPAILPVDGDLWFGTNRGVTKKSGREYSYISNDDLSMDGVFSLSEINDAIYVGGGGGISIIRPNQSIDHLTLPTNKEYQVWDILQTSDKAIWMATYQGGLFRMTDEGIESISVNPNYQLDDYLSIVEDNEKRLWIATFDGLYVTDLNGSLIHHIHSETGLSSDLCYSLFIDQSNSLWIGTNQGLNKINLNEYNPSRTLSVERYSYQDGFTGVECNCHASCETSDGQLYFGTVNGLFNYTSDPTLKKVPAPKPLITGMQVFYKDTLLPKLTKLDYHQNHIGFSFTGISLLNNRKIQYRHRLIGFEEEWSPPSEFKEARYPNLEPGKYRFEVSQRPNSRYAFSEPAFFEFEILQPWYQEWPFIALSIIGVILMAFGFIRWRVGRIREKGALEKRIESLKLQAFRSQMNPHFIFNAMNTIQYFINQDDKRQANSYLSQFAQLIRKVLNNSREDFITLEEDLEALQLYVDLEKVRTEAGFEFNVKLNSCDPEDIQIPPLLIQPFVENAIVHGIDKTGKDGLIELEVIEQEDKHIIFIRDNGIGREASMNKKKSTGHRSIATSLTTDRVGSLRVMHNDLYELKLRDWHPNEANPGTEIEIHIPKPKHYD